MCPEEKQRKIAELTNITVPKMCIWDISKW